MPVYRRKGSQNWLAEFHFNGQRFRASTQTSSKRQAQEFERKWRTSIVARHNGNRVGSITLAQALERHFVEVIQPKQPRRHTYQKGVNVAEQIVAHFGGDTPLEQIDTAAVAGWVEVLRRRGLKAGSVNRYVTLLKAVMRRAHSHWEVLDRLPRFDMLRGPQQRERYLTDAEIARLLAECPPHLRRLVIFMLGTGARLSEATDLTWSRVNLEGRGHVEFVRTKGGTSRSVPLPREVKEMLEEVREREGGAPGDKVFQWDTPQGERVPFAHPRSAWWSARSRAGLDDVKLHDLRHTYASRLVQRGVPLYTVQKLLGHSGPQMTQRYSHLRATDLDSAVSVLD